jgi:hypothetical protein
MADSSTSASAEPGYAAHTPDMTTVGVFYPSVPLGFIDRALWASVIRHARCADSSLDPDHWFPVSAAADKARHEAAAAIAVCATCQVRAHCLALSLRHWDIGQHGVWGGLVAADRAALRLRGRANVVPTVPQVRQPIRR